MEVLRPRKYNCDTVLHLRATLGLLFNYAKNLKLTPVSLLVNLVSFLRGLLLLGYETNGDM